MTHPILLSLIWPTQFCCLWFDLTNFVVFDLTWPILLSLVWPDQFCCLWFDLTNFVVFGLSWPILLSLVWPDQFVVFGLTWPILLSLVWPDQGSCLLWAKKYYQRCLVETVFTRKDINISSSQLFITQKIKALILYICRGVLSNCVCAHACVCYICTTEQKQAMTRATQSMAYLLA